jgi:hypothetical protein
LDYLWLELSEIALLKLVRLPLQRPGIYGILQWLCDKACDDALGTLNDFQSANKDTSNILHEEFIKNIEGPASGQLFIDRGDRVRLAFTIQTDFFNPNGTSRHENYDSISIISLVNLNLPKNICLQPKHVFLAGIIPSPWQPEKEKISHSLQPVINECLVS